MNNKLTQLIKFVSQKYTSIYCCFLGHKISQKGKYPTNKSGNFYTKYKCSRCQTNLGMPHLSEKYIKEKFPVPIKSII